MAKRKPVLRKFLQEYGARMGYDASSFPNKILNQVNALKKRGVVIEEEVGIRKFGGRWFSVDQQKFVKWLEKNVKPGPRHELKPIPDDQDPLSFLAQAHGVYNLRGILDYFETEVVDFYKVRNAAKKVEKNNADAREKVGAFIKNNIWVVEFPTFGDYLREHEPRIWEKHQRLLAGK